MLYEYEFWALDCQKAFDAAFSELTSFTYDIFCLKLKNIQNPIHACLLKLHIYVLLILLSFKIE